MRYIFIAICITTIYGTSLAQDQSVDTPTKSRHEYGLNLSPLVFQLVPFRNNSTRTGPYNFVYNYRRGARAFSMGLGANLSFDNDNEDLLHFNLRLGSRKYRTLTDHWEYYRGFDFIGTAGSFNLPQDGSSDSFGIGMGFPLGVVYKINENISVSTEGFLFIGLIFDDSGSISPIQVVPPISIMFNMAL